MATLPTPRPHALPPSPDGGRGAARCGNRPPLRRPLAPYSPNIETGVWRGPRLSQYSFVSGL